MGLAISDLSLSHFRSHKNTELLIDARPIAITGPNGAGKTNILEAVSLLSPGRGIRRATLDEMARAPEKLGWKVRARLNSLGHDHEIETWAETGQSRQVRIDGKAAPQIVLGKLAKIIWLVPTMDRLWLEGSEGRRRFLDRMTLSFFPSHAESVLSYDKAMRERNRLLKDGVADDRWYRALESQMADAGVEITSNRQTTLQRLEKAQADAQTAFPVADLTLFPNGADRQDDDFPECLARDRRRDMAAGRTLIGPHRAELAAYYVTKGVAAKLCSTGEQKALLISLILANARALTDDFASAPIILLDEVAAHLDVERRSALYNEICALNAQAWMTGTELALFHELDDRAQFLEIADSIDGSVTLKRGP